MYTRLVRLNWLVLMILTALLLEACAAIQSAPPSHAAVTTGCPNALEPISAPIVASAGGNLVAINEDGSDQHWLLSLSQDATTAFPAWSPDGQTLAYALRYPAPSPKRRGIISVICGLNRTTGKGQLLAAGTEDDWLDEPVWSPDGQSIMLTLNRFQYHADQQPVDKRNVARYNLTTRTLQLLVSDAHSPALSSTGDQLVYIAIEPKSQTESLFIAHSDGRDARQLITLQRPFVSAMWPRWSPDDTQILFGAGVLVGDENERYAPCVVGVDGRGFRQLSKDLNNVVSVDWAADSHSVVYVTSGHGLFIRDLKQEQVRNVMQAGDGMGVSWARH